MSDGSGRPRLDDVGVQRSFLGLVRSGRSRCRSVIRAAWVDRSKSVQLAVCPRAHPTPKPAKPAVLQICARGLMESFSAEMLMLAQVSRVDTGPHYQALR